VTADQTSSPAQASNHSNGTGPLLSVEDLHVRFRTEDGQLHAVRGVSYDLHRDEVFCVVGESGSGKSVSAMALMGLLPGSATITGTARFKDTELISADQSTIRALRGDDIAMIFQDPMTSLNPVYSVGDQLAEAIRVHRRVSMKKALEMAADSLDLVGIPQARTRVDAYPHEFSGGMRQRVMIAMAIINDPDLIIADEPTTALDVTVQAQVLEVLISIKERLNAAIMLITHDLGVVAGMADRVAVMYAGRFVEVGECDEIYHAPRMPYTIGLLGAIPSVAGDSERLTPIVGTPPLLTTEPDGCPFGPRCSIARDTCFHAEPSLVSVDESHRVACSRSDEVPSLLGVGAVEAGS
jgi:peptide/nickel transport system ATP-binding protein